MKKTLFSSDRPLDRAENLKAVWDAYDGPKEFVQYIPKACMALDGRVHSAFVVDCTPQPMPNKGDATVLFISHGISGDKLYGLDFSERHRAGCSQVDWAICTTEYSRELTMRQIGLSAEHVVATGFPLTDQYVGKRKGDGSTVLAEFPRAYLYVPTWRAPGNPPLPRIDWERVDSLLDGDEIVCVKRHMCTRDTIARSLPHVMEVSNMEPSAPYLVDCDVLVTDFSSIMFDGYALGKPSVLVTDGAEAYLESHGMYNDYPRWYGSIFLEAEGNEESLVAAMRYAAESELGIVERKCFEQVCGEIDGRASERVAELVRSFA